MTYDTISFPTSVEVISIIQTTNWTYIRNRYNQVIFVTSYISHLSVFGILDFKVDNYA